MTIRTNESGDTIFDAAPIIMVYIKAEMKLKVFRLRDWEPLMEKQFERYDQAAIYAEAVRMAEDAGHFQVDKSQADH